MTASPEGTSGRKAGSAGIEQPSLPGERQSADLAHRLRRVEQRLEAVLAIARLAGSDGDMPMILGSIREVVLGVLPAERLDIALFDADAQRVRFLADGNASDRKHALAADVALEQIRDKLIGHVLLGEHPLVGDGEQVRGQVSGLLSEDVARFSWLGIPVLEGGTPLAAVLARASLEKMSYGDAEVALLEFVAAQIRIAIDRRRVQQQIEEQLRERTQDLMLEVEDSQRSERLQSALFSVAELSNSAVDLGEFYRAVHGVVGEVIECRNICIAQLSKDDTELQFPYWVDERQPTPGSRPLGHGIIEYVLRTRGPLRIDMNDAAGRAEMARLIAKGAIGGMPGGLGAWLGVPLVCANKVIGVLSVQTYEPGLSYSERDQEFLAFIAYQIGNGLERQQAAATLRAANAALEQRVNERTRQLQNQMEAREQIERQLKHEVLHDFLTGLPNRAYLCDRLVRSLALQLRDPSKMFAVMFMDLDRFKVINDSAGHLVGDALLREVGLRLGTCVRVPDMVARLGGDEFAILIEDIGAVETAVRVAKRVVAALEKPINVEGKELFTSVSIGIAVSDPWYKEPEELLRDADIAMYRAKANDQQRFEIFNESLHQEALRVLELEGDLRRAIVKREFQPYFQTIVRLDDGAVIGYESLLRWNHPQRGMLAPNAFLSIAEASGSLEAIDWQMFDMTCAAVPSLIKPGQYMNLNFSPRHFRAKDMDARLLKLLSDHGVAPNQVRIEVTEGTLIDNPDQVSEIIERLHQAGVLTSLDDFGTGYSSLSYLHRFRLHAVKIDRSFVTPLMPGGGGGGSEAVVRAILALSKSQGLSVIAEGVETSDQRDALLALGCSYGQGYLYSRPQPLSALI